MWIKTSDRLPTENGDYLIAQQIFDYIIYDVVHWAKNLHEVDEYDFADEQYNRSGFYDFDSEWGYLERENVLAWQEIESYTEE